MVGRTSFEPNGPRLPVEVAGFHQSDHPRVAATLVGLLKQHRAEIVEMLAKGSVKDYPEYRFQCGRIDGIDIAIAAAEEARKKAEA